MEHDSETAGLLRLSMETDPFLKFKVGDKVSITHAITAKDVDNFANLTGDDNPLHMSDEFAREHLFGERVVHGMLSASFISTIICTKIPGRGALWQSQTLEFKGPARIGDTIKVEAEVTYRSEAQRILVLAISVDNQKGEPLIRGEAKVKVLKLNKKKKGKYLE